LFGLSILKIISEKGEKLHIWVQALKLLFLNFFSMQPLQLAIGHEKRNNVLFAPAADRFGRPAHTYSFATTQAGWSVSPVT
jgi:hypothetical protein